MTGAQVNLQPSRHIPILSDPVTHHICGHLSNLSVAFPHFKPPGTVVDLTFGGGGHSGAFLKEIQKKGLNNEFFVTGVDQDPDALARAQLKFQEDLRTGHLKLISSRFGSAPQKINHPVVGIFADLGISSDQIDSETRGFSFRYPSPLDMRMDPTQGETLAEKLQTVSESELAQVLFEFGEERRSRFIAKKLISLRNQGHLPDTTLGLGQTIASCFPPKDRHGRIHPATRSFQALRIWVNDELKEVDRILENWIPLLLPGCPIGILTFHSLEDRKIKHAFRNHPDLDVITKKAIEPDDQEIALNPRSRSAKLRVAVKKTRV